MKSNLLTYSRVERLHTHHMDTIIILILDNNTADMGSHDKQT